MLKVTLDTNCVINLLDYSSESATSVDALSEIIRYALEDSANIAITTRVQADLSNDKDEGRKSEMLRKIALFPTIGTVGRIGTTVIGGGDTFISDDDANLIKEMSDVVFPQLSTEDKHYKNKVNDIDHLFGHMKNRRDVFVTDDGGILKKREVLESSFGIRVVTPAELVDILNSQDNKNLLAKEYYENLKEYRDWLLEVLAESGRPNTEDERRYEKYREWFLMKTVKIQDELANMSFRNSSVPVGGSRVFDYGDIMRMQREKELLQGLFGEDTLSEQLNELTADPRNRHGYIRYESGSPSEKLRKKFKLHLDALLSLIGATE